MRRAAGILLLIALVAGCGSKGALYLPDAADKRSDNNPRR
jgi:predicted small lipoprotein YifL